MYREYDGGRPKSRQFELIVSERQLLRISSLQAVSLCGHVVQSKSFGRQINRAIREIHACCMVRMPTPIVKICTRADTNFQDFLVDGRGEVGKVA